MNYFLTSLKGKPYSLNLVEKILSKIDNITIQEEYKSVKATIDESISKDELDINFNIQETDKFFVERINIYGNNVTRESVIRNQLEIDEGDIFGKRKTIFNKHDWCKDNIPLEIINKVLKDINNMKEQKTNYVVNILKNNDMEHHCKEFIDRYNDYIDIVTNEFNK